MINLSEREEKILKYWKENLINDKVRKKNSAGKPFYFLDGPPYVTGDLHPGQMWVKSVKDITLRYKRYRGFNVRDRAGYDVHGLPIENKVEKQLGLNSKKEIETKIGIEAFVKKCREYVDSFMGRMDYDYNRFGISLDFGNPYLAYRSEYIDTAWHILKKIDERGFLYKGKKTTAYCTHCETALAQGSMEVTYADTDDPSIYVLFKADRKSSRIAIEDDTYLVIWTTTPWTLVANVAVAVNPKELYVMVKAGNRNMIVAKQRLESFVGVLNESLVVKSEFYGSELAGLKYLSPLEAEVPMQKELRKFHKVIESEDLVTMTEGTGLVHIAPGHGLDDYNLGIKNKLPIFSPVAPNGLYTEEAGVYKDTKVPEEANKRIMHELEKLGVLMGKGSLRHSYPHCWRCDSKLIYIATEQWFFNIQKMKKKLISENKKVMWHPKEAQDWLGDVIQSSPDWCISRQRYWGIPLPIWVCRDCQSRAVIGSLNELKEKATNKEKAESLKDLHRPHIDAIKLKCPSCSSEMDRITDVVDVWYDASIAFRASMTKEEFDIMFPVDYILEGKDQLRGWFSYLIKTSVMAYGKKPYLHVAIDGMLLDEKGREMHKKLGNYVTLDSVYSSVGADTFRLWCASHTPWLDLSWNESELKDAGKVVLILHNISNLLAEYQNALSYTPRLRNRLNGSKFDIEEAWILSRLESTIEQATGFLDNYEAYNAATLIKSFITEDLSRFYLKSAKKSLLYGSKRKAKQVMDVINYVVYRTLVMISPITPFVSEEVYLERYKNKESIFLESWPRVNKGSINKEIERKIDVAREAITATLNSREKAGIPLRQPISKATIELTDEYSYAAMAELSTMVEDYINAKKIELRKVSGTKKEISPMYAKIGPEFKGMAGAVAAAIRAADAEELVKAIGSVGYYELQVGNERIKVLPGHFSVTEKADKTDAAMFKFGSAYIDREISKELKDEAIIREFERHVQLTRKELNMKKMDKIALGYEANPEFAGIIAAKEKEIKKYLNASSLKPKLIEGIPHKSITIDDIEVKISVVKQS